MDLLQELAQAAWEGKADRIASLVAEGADPNGLVEGAHDHGLFLDRVTPLMIAAGSPRSNIETLSALLEAGAELGRTATGGVTPAWFAAGGGTRYPLTPKHLAELEPDHAYRNWGGGDAARLERLLDLGADVDLRDENGQAPLHEAAYGDWGSPTSVETLLANGVNPDPVDRHGNTPLSLAASRGEVECVRLLLTAGADPSRARSEARENLKA